MRSSGIAAQFTWTKGPRVRLLFAWIARATSSLPVPDSPVMRTVALVGAERRIAFFDLLHGRAFADHLIVALETEPQTANFLFELLALGCVSNRQQDTFGFQGLLDEVESAELRRLHCGLYVSVSANDDDLGSRRLLLELLESIQTIDARHLDIQENEIGRVGLNCLQGLRTGGRLQDLEAFVLQSPAHRLSDGLFVVHDEYARFHERRDSSTRPEPWQ